VFLPELLDEVSNRFGLQTIFHDCSFRKARHEVHSTYGELTSLPEDLRQMVVCTHYEDDFAKHLRRDERDPLPLAKAGEEYPF